MTSLADLPLAALPWFCLLYFLSLVACLYGGIAAALCRVPARGRIVRGALFAACFLPTAALTEGCYALYYGVARPFAAPVLRAPAWVWAAAGVALLAVAIGSIARLNGWRRAHITPMSVKDSADRLPTGLCFGYSDGVPRLVNLRMDALCRALTGDVMADMNAFWDAAAGAEPRLRGERLGCSPEGAVRRLPDGSVWTLERHALSDGAREIVASDTTRAYALGVELEGENRRLREMNARLKRYGETVDAATREMEILSAKARIHDELGQALLAARRCVAGPVDPSEREAARDLWRRCAELLRRENQSERGEADLDALREAARAIGVTIDLQGELPRAGSEAARLVVHALHECLTNAVRHADGTRLRARVERGRGAFTLLCENDGRVPDGAIREGGGLSALRARLTNAGGQMRIVSAPRFQLIATIPEECDEIECGNIAY